MSSILKALQKLEREREVRQGKPANIHKGILREDRRLRKGGPWLILLSISVTALAAVLLTYSIFGKTEERRPVATKTTSPETHKTPQPQEVSPEGPSTVLLPSPVIRQTPPPRLEALPAQNRQPEQHTLTANPPVSPPQPIIPAPQPAVANSLPTLNVAGIGWREEPASRIAVINGSPVGEGALIDGAKVEEIFPDRVRFSYEKKLFDVPVGKSASPH